jgi:hypothetical protein
MGRKLGPGWEHDPGGDQDRTEVVDGQDWVGGGGMCEGVSQSVSQSWAALVVVERER